MDDRSDSNPPTIEILRPRPQTLVVALGGEHDLYAAPKLQQSLDPLVRGCRHLIVDLSSAEFIDSTTITALLRAKRLADEDGQRFNVVSGASTIAERTLEVAGVRQSLNVLPSLEQALASPRGTGRDLANSYGGRGARRAPAQDWPPRR